MNMIIDGKVAVLKKGSSFEYVSENRAFSDADDYTMSITLPLAGCSENIAIFGHIERMDVTPHSAVYEASLIAPGFAKHGVVTIVEANEAEVKVQFLEGRSVQNFLTTFDDIYINELDLGEYPTYLPKWASLDNIDIDHGHNYVPLPWWNDSSDGIMNNEVVVVNGAYQWADSTKEMGKLSYMPYLIFIAKEICKAQGYTYDFLQWEQSDDRFLLVCNALPAPWDIPQVARALPHWTVTEFFEELEKLLVCEINIDHKARHISMAYCNKIVQTQEVVALDDVVDAFSTEATYKDALCKFKGAANVRYADRGDETWKYDQCQWLVDLLKTDGKYYLEFNTWDEFWDWAFETFGVYGGRVECDRDSERPDKLGYLVHIIESDTFQLLRVGKDWKWGFTTVEGMQTVDFTSVLATKWTEVNRFGDLIRDTESGNDIELNMLPVRIEETDEAHGLCVFLSPSGYNEEGELDEDDIRQPMAMSMLLKGEPDSEAEYYDKIYLAYWDGHSANQTEDANEVIPPCPITDHRFNLRIRYTTYLNSTKVNHMEKLKASWLSNKIPNVRAIFNIRGKLYLAEKITATFTAEAGMSQLLTGIFYPLSEG